MLRRIERSFFSATTMGEHQFDVTPCFKGALKAKYK